MNKEKKVLICSVLNHLAQRDPWWKDNPNAQRNFKNLYDAWRQKELRQKRHSKAFYSIAWQRGWLHKADFERFRAYAME